EAKDDNEAQKHPPNDEASLDRPYDLPFRIIFVSDNAKVVDNICKYRKQWREEDGKLVTKQKKPVKNGAMYQELDRALLRIESRYGLVLKFYCVPKERNKGAAKLAKDALQGNFCGEIAKAMGPVKGSG
ncbi:hypothetical protein PC116_g31371, partial [Phytophthora cactorum]